MGIYSKIEISDAELLQEIQLSRLKKTIKWAFEKSSFYRKKFVLSGVSLEQIKTLADIRLFPLTMKEEYMTTSPYDFLALPLSGISRVSLWEHPEPVIKMYTARDIEANVDVMMRLVSAAGINRTSVVGLIGDLSDSALMDLQSALEKIGVAVVMLSTEYERALRLLNEVGIDVLIGSSRRILQLIVIAQAQGKDISEYPIKDIMCINDMIQNPLMEHIEQRTQTQVTNIFASSVLGTAGILCQCEERYGWHFQSDLFLPELLEPGTENIITEAGKIGELVVTTLATEAMPLIRYRTGQMVMMKKEQCACKRSFPVYVTPFARKNNC